MHEGLFGDQRSCANQKQVMEISRAAWRSRRSGADGAGGEKAGIVADVAHASQAMSLPARAQRPRGVISNGGNNGDDLRTPAALMADVPFRNRESRVPDPCAPHQ